MKRILALLCLALAFSVTAYSQFTTRNANRLRSGTAVPTMTCSPGPSYTDIYIRTTTGVHYTCTAAPNTWTPDSSGGGGITNGAASGVIPKSDGTNLITSNISDSGTVVTVAKPLTTTSVSTTGTITHSIGSGLSDISKSGTFSGITGYVYTVAIDATGTPDTFSWDDGAGGGGNAGVAITGAAQPLGNGVSVTFAATTGHTLNDAWTFTTTATSGVVVKNAAGVAKTFLNGDGNLFLGHAAIGADRGVHDNVTLTVFDTYSGIEDPMLMDAVFTVNAAADGKAPSGIGGELHLTGTHPYSGGSGIFYGVFHEGSGLVDSLNAAAFEVALFSTGSATAIDVMTLLGGTSSSTGAVGTLRTLVISSPRHTGGDITTISGIEIEDQTTAGATTVRNLYSKGATSLNVFEGKVQSALYSTATNCADSAGAAACGSAAAGSIVIDAGATSVVVSTTAVTADSQIFVQYDSSLSTRLSVTCNTTVALPAVTARTAATSFTITVPVAPAVNPACYSFHVIN